MMNEDFLPDAISLSQKATPTNSPLYKYQAEEGNFDTAKIMEKYS